MSKPTIEEYDEGAFGNEYGFVGENFSLYMRDIQGLAILDDDQLKSIYIQMEKEPERRQELINRVVEANLRLVVFFAKRYVNRGLEFQDLVQFGNIGLVLAAWKYDYRKCTKFSTLASSWIVHEIERSISLYARPVRLPENVLLEQLQISKAESQLHVDLGRKPRDEEIAEKIGISQERLLKMRVLKEASLSLDASLKEEGGLTLAETIPGNTNVSDQVIKGINADMIREILQSLPEKERYILEHRYGDEFNTLQELGDEFKISKEAVRQKQKSAIEKFKKIMRRKRLTVDDLLS